MACAERFAAVQDEWLLDPAITFLNHGSFGSCPRPVLAAQNAWRAQMEARPVEFLYRRLFGLLRDARAIVADFLNADPDGMVFVTNVTVAMNAVVRSLPLDAGDEIVTTDHAYPAVLHLLERICSERDATLVVVPVPLPLPTDEQIVRAIDAALSERTRLVVADHVSSSTAVVFPIEAIVRACRARSIPVMVDAAHAPGMLPVDIGALGADIWTGNFHKWVCAPKGTGALWLSESFRDRVRPPVISHDYLRGPLEEFGWLGTHDPTAHLAVPAALDFMGSLGWSEIRRHNDELARAGGALAREVLGSAQLVPDRAARAMTIAGLPPGIGADRDAALAIQAALLERFAIEIPVVAWNGRGIVRLSAQVYNRPEQYERLAEGLRSLA